MRRVAGAVRVRGQSVDVATLDVSRTKRYQLSYDRVKSVFMPQRIAASVSASLRAPSGGSRMTNGRIGGRSTLEAWMVV